MLVTSRGDAMLLFLDELKDFLNLVVTESLLI